MLATEAYAGPYAAAGGNPGSPAVSVSDPSILEWASGAVIQRGLRDVEQPTEYDSDPTSPLNFAFYGGSDGASDAASAASIAAGGSPITSSANSAPVGMPSVPQSTYYAVSLGQNGSATLTFNMPIGNGPGNDFAVFGNGFTSGSQEWVKPALVQVSSDGVHFFQFPSVSLTPASIQVGDYDELDPTNLYDIAGKDPAGWGTPFDLSELAGVSPLLNVNAVTAVRILGVSGDINPAFARDDSAGNVINGPYPAASEAGSEGFGLAGVAVLNEQSLAWSNAAGTGAWNTTDANWNLPGNSYHNGQSVVFDNSILAGNQTVHLNVEISPASITVNNSSGDYRITGSGGIAGVTGLTKTGSSKLTLETHNTFTGDVDVFGGILELAIAGSLPAGNAVQIGGGGEVVADENIGLLVVSSLNLNSPAGQLVGKLDLTNNGLVVHNGDLTAINAAIQSGANNLAWNGTTGISSSTAAADTTYLSALGVIQNVNPAGGALYTSSFDGASGLNLSVTDVLIRYSCYGDANLDGLVDGSDYSLIDNGYLQQLTGWQNGDFNYDQIVDGSDFTLIDNSFNLQGVNETAETTGQIAAPSTGEVPEPGAGLSELGMISLLTRRSRISKTSGFTLVELLIVTGIIGLLTAILLPSLTRTRQQAQQVVCSSNIRQLCLANLLYAADNRSFCVPASADIFNDLGDGQGGHFRWHGARNAANQPFDPARGPLVSYLGKSGDVKNCPVFDQSIGPATGNNFEAGCGGYGYNEMYVGGRSDVYGYCPAAVLVGAKLPQILHGTQTVMFTDSGIAQPYGSAVIVTEYSFCEPPLVQENPGTPSKSQSWPSIHFRHRGRANVAWADGHVSAELMTFSNQSYGLPAVQVRKAGVGWFGADSNALFEVAK